MKFLIPICFGLILLGCDKPLSQQEVVGLYTADFGAGSDTIELRPDGTYVHLFSEPGAAAEVRNEGSWRMTLNGNENRIVFENFVFAPRTSGAELRAVAGRANQPVSWGVEIYRAWNGVRLTADADLGHFYRK